MIFFVNTRMTCDYFFLQLFRTDTSHSFSHQLTTFPPSLKCRNFIVGTRDCSIFTCLLRSEKRIRHFCLHFSNNKVALLCNVQFNHKSRIEVEENLLTTQPVKNWRAKSSDPFISQRRKYIFQMRRISIWYVWIASIKVDEKMGRCIFSKIKIGLLFWGGEGLGQC